MATVFISTPGDGVLHQISDRSVQPMVLNPDPIAELETQKNNLLTCQFK